MSFKAALLGAVVTGGLQPVPYTDPTTGEKAFLKRFTIGEREAYYKQLSKAEDGKGNATAMSLFLVDANGNRIFSDEDIDSLAQLPDVFFDNAMKAFAEINDPKTSVEQAEKN